MTDQMSDNKASSTRQTILVVVAVVAVGVLALISGAWITQLQARYFLAAPTAEALDAIARRLRHQDYAMAQTNLVALQQGFEDFAHGTPFNAALRPTLDRLSQSAHGEAPDAGANPRSQGSLAPPRGSAP